MRFFGNKFLTLLVLAAFLPGCSAIKQFFAEKDPDARVAQEERDFQMKHKAILKAAVSFLNM